MNHMNQKSTVINYYCEQGTGSMNGKFLVLASQSKIAQDQQLMARAEDLALSANERVIQQIAEGDLEVSKTKTNLNKVLKQATMAIKSKSVPHLEFPVPDYTLQDELRIREMIRKHKENEQKLELAAKQLEQRVRTEEQALKEKMGQQKKRMFQQRIAKVRESIQYIQKRHQNRRRLSHEENVKLGLVKSQKKLYQILEEEWKRVEQEQRRQKEKRNLLERERRKISFEEIKEHTIKHDETMSRFRESRLAQSRASQPEVIKFYQSVFMSRIIEADQELKEDNERKKMRAKEFAEKRQEYANIVKENYKPRIAQPVPLPPQIRTSKSLSHLQTFEKGNGYMKEVNNKLSTQRSKTDRKSSLGLQIEKQSFKYKNYLTEMRLKKNEIQKQMRPNQRTEKESSYQKEIRKIMRQAGLSEQQRFTKAKLVTKRMENLGVKKNPFRLIESINAKLEILKHVSG